MRSDSTASAIDDLLDYIDIWRHRARLCAATNPIGFVVATGADLPGYLARLDELEGVLCQAREHIQR